MIRSKPKWQNQLIKLILPAFGLSLFILAIYLSIFSEYPFVTDRVLIIAVILLNGLLFMYLGTVTLKSLRIDGEAGIITFIYLGIFRKNIPFDAIRSHFSFHFNPPAYAVRSTMHKRTIIETVAEKQYVFTSLDFSNYQVLKHEIERLQKKQPIKEKTFGGHGTYLMAYLLIETLLMGILAVS